MVEIEIRTLVFHFVTWRGFLISKFQFTRDVSLDDRIVAHSQMYVYVFYGRGDKSDIVTTER